MSALERFTSHTPPEAVADLRRRLAATRHPVDLGGEPWRYGADPDEIGHLLAHWADGYDWPAHEAALNRLPRYRIDLGGLGIHLLHAPSATGRGLPLLLAHGWPDSFWRYTKVLSLLTDPGAHGGDPDDAFEVIVPDMPGYGYSDVPATALDSIGVAHLWADLMAALGHDRYAAAGGDIGSGVVRFLALDHPDRVLAVHRTDAGLPHPSSVPEHLTPDELVWMTEVATWSADEGAYARMHATKPQTAAYGLSDSPAGLAAWIGEKMQAWSDGGLHAYTVDEILTNLSIYWFTGTVGPSMRMYAANAAISPEQRARRVEVPSGFTIFPHDLSRAPRAWLERTSNLAYHSEPAVGGHFAAFEQPELYAQELRDFFRPYR